MVHRDSYILTNLKWSTDRVVNLYNQLRSDFQVFVEEKSLLWQLGGSPKTVSSSSVRGNRCPCPFRWSNLSSRIETAAPEDINLGKIGSC
jgi:hypothetical protein